MNEHARELGKLSRRRPLTQAQVEASRRNGRLGGRPRRSLIDKVVANVQKISVENPSARV